MRVTYAITWDYNHDENGAVVFHAYDDGYTGLVAQCGDKKGRKAQAKLVADEAARRAAEDVKRNEQYARTEPTIAMWEGTEKGGMSPLAAAETAAEQERNARQYRSITEAGFKSLGQRGFGRAPSGFTSSFKASLGRGKNEADTAAFRAGLGRTDEQRQRAVNYRAGAQQLASGATGQAAGITSEAAYRQSQMGSGWGDALGAVVGLADVASKFYDPTGGGFGTLTGKKKKTAPTAPRGFGKT